MKKLLTLLFILQVIVIQAQIGAPSGGGGTMVSDTSTIAKAKFVPAPLINYSRSIGFAGGVVPMYMWNINKKDTISPQSLVGGLGMYSTNKTYFGMGFARLYLNEDKWRIQFGGGNGNVNFQVFIHEIVNDYVDYGTSFWFFKAQIERKIFKSLYGGIVIDYTGFDTIFDLPTNPEIENSFTGFGLILENDLRDNVYYPYGGSQASLEWNSYPIWLGNEDTSNKLTPTYNRYISFRDKKDVLATRIYGEFGLGEIAFNQEVVVMGTDLRGYTQGKYRGKGMVDIQAEYRYNFSKKMGMVGFAGLGTIYGATDEENNGLILPSIGTGFRYNIFPANHMNIGLDAAVGRDDWGIYFRIGEAF